MVRVSRVVRGLMVASAVSCSSPKGESDPVKPTSTVLERLGLEKSKVRPAWVGADAVRVAAELFLLGDPRPCPTPKDLVDADKLDASQSIDPWGTPYRIVCGDRDAGLIRDVLVISNGRDGLPDTPDDVRGDAKPSDLKRLEAL